MDTKDIVQWLDLAAIYGKYLQLHGSNEERRALCCWHDDHHPSLGINMRTGLYYCQVCKAKGDVFAFWQKMNNCTFPEAAEALSKLAGVNLPPPQAKPAEVKPIDPTLVTKWHEALMANEERLGWLRNVRGFTDGNVEFFQIGWDGERYTLPLYWNGELFNVKRYKPNAKADEPKWLWLNKLPDGVRSCLFPQDVFEGCDTVILPEGEWDAVLGFRYGYAVATGTSGASTWHDEWTPYFKRKIVIIGYDNDESGRAGAMQAAEKLSGTAASVRLITWPADMPNKGDLTDYFVTLKHTKAEFDTLIAEAKEYTSAKTRKIPRPVKGIMPQNGFLSSYISYASDMTDAPVEFHLATGLAILGAVTGNRISFVSWGQNVCLNMWSVLIAPSGFYRKSTAMNIGLKLLREVDSSMLLPDDFSKEALLKTLVDRPSGILTPSEFGAMVEHFGKEYMRGTMETLTALYDCPHEYGIQTISRGIQVISKPAVNFLGASTIDWLQTSIKDLRGGFIPRFLFWPATEKGEWKGMTQAPSDTIRYALVEYLAYISKLSGQLEFDREVRHRFDEWTREHEEAFNQDKLPAVLLGFYSRMTTYVGKLGVLYHLSAHREIGVDLESLEAAIRTVEYLKSHLTKLVTQDFTFTREASKLKEIRELIALNGTIEHSEVIRQSRMMKFDLDRVLQTLLEAEEIEVIMERRAGRPKRSYQVKGLTSGEVGSLARKLDGASG